MAGIRLIPGFAQVEDAKDGIEEADEETEKRNAMLVRPMPPKQPLCEQQLL